MINGLEVLTRHEILESSMILTLIEIIVGLILVFYFGLRKKNIKRMIIFGILTAFFEIIIININFVHTNKYEYMVKVSKEASALELYNNYEIVSQDQDIWVIKDK